ncbi:hypothetical protein [Boudabousia marimammalium]|uniref:Ig-like domain-containing protein n=1 Tax=Boudabousia marimammalium TaxID=156892 RepID=A0A1Q5PJX8_9ACTO|nr:hypothetical protein [Boudabousia marimammalium]OKL46235.1 hypothetical protein BM477_07335 [Boudabousia marimammalium]
MVVYIDWNMMKLNKHLLAAFAAVSLMIVPGVAPASAATSSENGFSITLEEVRDGNSRHLEWRYDQCVPTAGETAKVTFSLAKEGTSIPIGESTRLELGAEEAGTYTLNATCKYSAWLAPEKRRVTLTIDALPAQPEVEPAQPEVEPSQPGNNTNENEGPFTLYFDQAGEADEAKLTWRTTGCRAPQEPEISLKRDGQTVDIVGLKELPLKDQPAGTYTMTAKCSPEWLAPTVLTKSVTVTKTADETPAEPTPPATNSDLVIESAEFQESPVGRTFSWKATGCSAQNERSVKVSVLFNGHETSLLKSSRTETVNASQWPTGNYTVVAKCVSLKDQSVLQTLQKDVTLGRSNLPTTFAGRALNYLIPRPGDRVQISSYPTHNALILKDGTKAEPFKPGEEVKISFAFNDAEPLIEGPTLTADQDGHVETDLWIPLKSGAQSFTIFAVGQQSNSQLDYRSVIAPHSGHGISVAEVPGKPRSLKVVSYQPEGSAADRTFSKNTTISLEVVDSEGNTVATIPVTTTAAGTLDNEIQLPKSLTVGRYTIFAPTVLQARGDYAAYFYFKDGKAWAQWEEPASEPAPQVIPALRLVPAKKVIPALALTPAKTVNPAAGLAPEQAKTLIEKTPAAVTAGATETAETTTTAPAADVQTAPVNETASSQLAKTGVNLAEALVFLVLFAGVGVALTGVRRA